jgi:hypothetical protein
VYLQLISRFDLANKVPVEGEITFTDLAAIIGVDRAALCCILRLGIAYHIFKEPRPGVITHSAASRQIAENPRVASWVGANVDDMWPSAEKVVDALVKWPLAAEPNQTVSKRLPGLVDDRPISRDSHRPTGRVSLSTPS